MKKIIALLVSIIAFNISADIIQMNRGNVQEILNSSQPVVIDVYAIWCPPCMRFAPIFKKASDQFGELYRFAKLNGDEEPDLLSQLKITAYPTILFMKGGKEIGRHVGAMGNADFEIKLKEYF